MITIITVLSMLLIVIVIGYFDLRSKVFNEHKKACVTFDLLCMATAGRNDLKQEELEQILVTISESESQEIKTALADRVLVCKRNAIGFNS